MYLRSAATLEVRPAPPTIDDAMITKSEKEKVPLDLKTL